MPKRTVVLAGGAGTRLRPYTTVLPKPLMPVGDRPVLDIVLRQLRAAGCEHVTIATGWLAELIEAVCGNGDTYGLKIDYFREREPLGTVGALATIATTTRTIEVSLGVMRFEQEGDPGKVTDYIEKPTLSYEASMGVYAFDPRVLAHVEPDVRLDFPDLVLRLLAAGETVRGHRPGAYWLDLGRHEDYETAMAELDTLRGRLLGLR